MTGFFRSRGLRLAAGYVLALACLVWVFRGTDWREVARSMAGFRWSWAVLAVVLQLLSFVGQGFRWRLLLAPLGPVRLLRTTQAVYCGLGMTFIVPFGFGEVTRGYFISGWMSRPFVSVLPSIALERLFDAIWLAVGIGVTAIAVKLPRNLDRAADIFGGVVLALVGLVLFASVRSRRSGRDVPSSGPGKGGLRRRLASVSARLGEGFRSIGFSRGLAGAFFVSLAMFGLQALALWFLMRAYGLGLPFPVAVAVFFITLFGTAVPVAPAGIGTYQFFCVVALTLLGVDRTAAAGFSIVAYIFLNLPLLAVCLFALSRCGMTLSSIKERIGALKGRRD